MSGRGPIIEPPPDPGPPIGLPPPTIEPPSAPPLIGAKPPATPSTAPANVTSVSRPTDGIPQSGAQLWMRKWHLTVGPASGETNKAIDLSLLDFEFDVQQEQNTPPWYAHIKVWNPGQSMIQKLAAKELTHVLLEAGYQSPSRQYGRLFTGQINYFKQGRQSGTDHFVELYASTFDMATNAAVVNTWLPAGHQAIDSIKAAVTAMSPYGVVLGQVPDDLDAAKSPRGRTLFGMARDILRDIERTEEGHFFIDLDGKLHLLRDGDVLNMGSQIVPILNAHTGLIDVPTRTMEGAVEVVCLLNPAITPGMQIRLNNADVFGYTEVNNDAMIDDAQKFAFAQSIKHDDGYYPVGSVRHQGQNRGNPWYSHIVTQKALQGVGLRTSIA